MKNTAGSTGEDKAPVKQLMQLEGRAVGPQLQLELKGDCSSEHKHFKWKLCACIIYNCIMYNIL